MRATATRNNGLPTELTIESKKTDILRGIGALIIYGSITTLTIKVNTANRKNFF